jgi:hypothetical protein
LFSIGPSPIGEQDLKKVATLIVTAFPANQKMKPILLFKGGGNVSKSEKRRWHKDVIVRFNGTATVDEKFMLQYAPPTPFQVTKKSISTGNMCPC